MNKGWLSTPNPLPLVGALWIWACLHGLVPLGQVVCILQNGQQMLAMGFHSLWTFVSTYFGFFYKHSQWVFDQLVVIFETIGQVSKIPNTFVNILHYDEFYTVNNVHGF